MVWCFVSTCKQFSNALFPPGTITLLQSQKKWNFLLVYLITDIPRTLTIRALRKGFHKLMHSSLVIVTLGHGPFFSESADASVRLGLLHLLHHSSQHRSGFLLTKRENGKRAPSSLRLLLSSYVTPNSWDWGARGSMSITWDISWQPTKSP